MAKKLVPGFCQKRVTRWTVARRLREFGFGAHVAAKKPLLSYDNICKRLEWAKAHEDWTAEDWKREYVLAMKPLSVYSNPMVRKLYGDGAGSDLKTIV
jgi:hypothetical protein